MSIAVDFYSAFTKRVNSTKKPTASDSYITAYCELKDNCSMLEPVLEIYGSGSSFNPKYYYYCHITSFDRYYFINDWEYEKGIWICYCKVDVLGRFKTQIGLESKYILRSSYASNINIVDTFYPSLAWKPNYYYDTVDFQFARSFAQGSYILGIANTDANFGALSYYVTNSPNITKLIHYMLNPTSEIWDNPITGMTDTLYRAIYQPFDYIKSCKWFPISSIGGGGTDIPLKFGNYSIPSSSFDPDDIPYGAPLDKIVTNWYSNYRELTLPSSWLSLEAKYRVNPYANIFLVFNPWGIIELNPTDFTDSNTIRLTIYPDCISGDCMLKIHKKVGGSLYFITEKNVNLSVDINLSASSVNASAMISGAASIANGFALAASDGASAVMQGAIAESAGILDIAQGLTPTARNSVGQSFGGSRAMEGTATLVYTSTYFANEDNAVFGKPLCDTRQISTIPGYIQCKDDHIEIDGAMLQELEQIGEYLTGGFYYE